MGLAIPLASCVGDNYKRYKREEGMQGRNDANRTKTYCNRCRLGNGAFLVLFGSSIGLMWG